MCVDSLGRAAPAEEKHAKGAASPLRASEAEPVRDPGAARQYQLNECMNRDNGEGTLIE